MSGRRFGGAYSPGAKPGAKAGAARPVAPQSRFSGAPASRVDIRARLMFVLPAPLMVNAILAIIGGNVVETALSLLSFALLMTGAWLLSEGQKAAQAYEARSVARRPAIPRKIIAAVLAGAGVAAAQFAGPTGGLFGAIGFALLATGSHIVAFGIDPLANKGIDLNEAELARVADAIDGAEETLREIGAMADGIRDREISERLASLSDEVRALLRRIEADPRDLTRARRYLSVHLVGAHEATRKYAESHAALDDPTLREDYLTLLSELEDSFMRGRDKMLADDKVDLEVEIEVLRDRLGQEGAADRR
ncbi:MAG: 5-bromo-4-chloroindolyl phosphate hydrolysis family protein [Pseudomonadota bacterium]